MDDFDKWMLRIHELASKSDAKTITDDEKVEFVEKLKKIPEMIDVLPIGDFYKDALKLKVKVWVEEAKEEEI